MTRTWVAVLAFAGGIGVGLVIAKLYARQQATSAVHDLLGSVGLGGGKIESAAQTVVTGLV